MKLITAIIQPFMIDKLARVLRKEPISGYTVSKVDGSGRDLALSPDYLRPRAKVEIAVNDEQVKQITELIAETVGTHQEGDGIVFVTAIETVINIQTGMKNETALKV